LQKWDIFNVPNDSKTELFIIAKNHKLSSIEATKLVWINGGQEALSGILKYVIEDERFQISSRQI